MVVCSVVCDEYVAMEGDSEYGTCKRVYMDSIACSKRWSTLKFCVR